MKKLLPLSALVLLSLPSCLLLQTGAIIRHPARYAEAVDASKPLQNQAYKISDNQYVYQAPVIQGALQKPLLYTFKSAPYRTKHQKATGTWHWVKIYRHKKGSFQATLLNQKPKLKGAKLVDTSRFSYTGNVPFDFGTQRTTTTRRILAAPFDYVIDPILSISLTGGILAVAPFAIPFTMTQGLKNEPAAIPAADPNKKLEKKELKVNISYR